MAKFELVSSFGIDHGELDGLSPQECFVLGYELAQVDHLLETGDAIEKPVHSENKGRIQKRCINAGRVFSMGYMSDDRSESWIMWRVAARS